MHAGLELTVLRWVPEFRDVKYVLLVLANHTSTRT